MRIQESGKQWGGENKKIANDSNGAACVRASRQVRVENERKGKAIGRKCKARRSRAEEVGSGRTGGSSGSGGEAAAAGAAAAAAAAAAVAGQQNAQPPMERREEIR